MAASAQISYPAAENEEDGAQEQMEERVEEQDNARDLEGGGKTELEDTETDETEVSEWKEEKGYIHRESGRTFDVSCEDFCADAYAVDGDRETRLELGKKGEDAAVRYLLSKGYDILTRNWFCKFGEADIIARDPDGSLCFIEVKTRKSIEAGFPEEAITKDKRKRYERIALAYMMIFDDWDDQCDVRFDAICICVTGPHRALLRHHKGSFDDSF